VAADGEVVDIDPGRFVTMTFHPRWSPEIEAEGPVRMTWQIDPAGPDVTKLTVTTAGMRAGGVIQGEFGGGVVYIVSGLKSWLETGEPLGPLGSRRSRRRRSPDRTRCAVRALSEGTGAGGQRSPGPPTERPGRCARADCGAAGSTDYMIPTT
jgi:hypothetical protein